MAVKWLLHWQPAAGTPVMSQTLMEVVKSLDAMNATRVGRWTATTAHYRPNQREQTIPVESARELLGVAFSDAPNKHFFVLRMEHMVVEADSNITAIMEKLQAYRNRLTVVFEGFQYQFGDFQIKAGRAMLSHSENIRGILMEVEYLPVSSIEKARSLMQEFVDFCQDAILRHSANGRFIHLEPNFADYSLPDQYNWQHTALQYISIMAYFMSQRS